MIARPPILTPGLRARERASSRLGTATRARALARRKPAAAAARAQGLLDSPYPLRRLLRCPSGTETARRNANLQAERDERGPVL
eukprot:4892662-Pyramimonas_sp.AAC.1